MEQSLVDIYNLTLLHEALAAGHKVRTSDINQIYATIPGNLQHVKKSKNGKIREICEYFDNISTETIARLLVEKQLKDQNGK